LRHSYRGLFAAGLAPTAANAQAVDVQFRQDYNDTRREADKKGLPVLIYITSDSCYWCMRLQQEPSAILPWPG